MAFGMRWHDSGALFFYSSFVLGIMMEDGVQAIWRQKITADSRQGNGLENRRKRKMDSGKETPIWQKVVGFAWVSLWFTITTPGYLGRTCQALGADLNDFELPSISGFYLFALALSLIAGAGFLRWGFGANI
jgi:hypothetical protein